MTKKQMLDLIVFKIDSKLAKLKVSDLQKISSNIFDELQHLTNINKSQTQK